jgi:hypothetical protein
MNNEKQTPLHRLARLVQGQCPIHGIFMNPVHTDSGLPITVYCFPRPDCLVTVNQFPDGAFELPREMSDLLAKQQ